MADLAAGLCGAVIFASGFGAAAYLGVNGHAGLAVGVLIIIACVRIKSSTTKDETTIS